MHLTELMGKHETMYIYSTYAFFLQTHTQTDINSNQMQERICLKDLAQKIGQVTQNSFHYINSFVWRLNI